MRLQHTHDLAGAGRVNVNAPEMPVFITLNIVGENQEDDSKEYRAVDIMADAGLAAWAGPSGIGGVALGIEVNRPGILTSLKRTFLRNGSFASGGGTVTSGGTRSVVSGGGRGGSVRATGRGSIACGGSISGMVVTGDGAMVGGLRKPEPLPPVGVHITAPVNSTFHIKGAKSVSIRSEHDELTLRPEQFLGEPWYATIAGRHVVVGR